ncbi:MAG: hypothetical protein ABI921_01230 [Panacibacter sp.]
MAYANVELSETELLLVCDEQFILTKNRIIDKVYDLFGALNADFMSKAKEHKIIFPPEVLLPSPKIYKGEQYLGLPYVMLDCPRYFVRNEAFTIRCFFWWGNFFSITLHLEGSYAAVYVPVLLDALRSLENNSWHICINEDKWEHHFEMDNYLPANKVLQAMKETPRPEFLKIAKKIPLQQWGSAYQFFTDAYSEIFKMLDIVVD